jgi:hypothetical protein
MNKNLGIGGDSDAAHNVMVDRHRDDTCVTKSMKCLQHWKGGYYGFAECER